ncbi:AraC family transcriptional regulator [Micromonospora sp. NPDC050187]|uniref:AraC family transcriptional regulator n=1 Tax=Micromonospora sp. NPDC050187 TaxID=3364277 RepID=UPI00378BCBE3
MNPGDSRSSGSVGGDLLRRHLTPGRERQRRVPGVRIRPGAGGAGIERLAAELRGEAFSPHRHDRYAVGVTLAGVQTFRYRAEQHHCLPGEWHVLHPDEPHDGAGGTDEGFGYRIVYLDPAVVRAALDGDPLPFVADPVIRPVGVPRVLADALAHLDEPLDEVGAVEVGTAIADLLRAHAAPAWGRRRSLDLAAVARVRALLTEEPTVRHRAGDLELVAGLDRWSVARQFRVAYGTSPTRYRTSRQLDLARGLIRAGVPLPDVAVRAGFADQAHLTRMFRRAYGLTPAVWSAAVGARRPGRR